MNQPNNNQYPHNKPYIQSAENKNNSSPRPSRSKPNQQNSNHSPSNMSASALADRVQDLEQQLVLLANALNEEGRENQGWQEQLMAQNKKLRDLLQAKEEQIEEIQQKLLQRETETKLLKDNLFKQNQDMEQLHKELQESRLQNSKVERTSNPQLQEKVLELNDEISTLLVKIQKLIEQNNQQLSYSEDLQKSVQQYKNAYEECLAEVQRLTDENHYLKEQIKQVQSLSISQQKQVQNRLLEELQQTKGQIQKLKMVQNQSRILDKTSSEKEKSGSQKYHQIETLKAEIHSLEEEILQQRQVQRSYRKKYEERLRLAEDQISFLNEELSKSKQKNRQLQHSNADISFALEQIKKEKERGGANKFVSNQTEHYRSIISKLQTEKEEMKLKIVKLEAFQKQETNNDYYFQAINEANTKISVLREQLDSTEEQLARSRRSTRQMNELAKRWEQDYKILSEQYEQSLKSKGNFQQQMRKDQTELQNHKQVYEKLVKKCSHFEEMYKQLQNQVKLLQESKGQSLNFYDKESSDLIKLQNSSLRQQIAQLKQRVEQLSYKLLSKDSKPNNLLNNQIERYKLRQKQLERLLQTMRNRLANESNNFQNKEHLYEEVYSQLQRVNKMLNQRQMELDSMKERYEDLHRQLSKKDQANVLPKHHPELTKLKADYVAVHRKLMENQLAAKNALQNADYQIQSLKIQNTHHRKKIDELLKELTSERTNTDYRNLLHSLELSEARNRQLERELEHCQQKIKDLYTQLRRPSSRQKRTPQHKPFNEYSIRINDIPSAISQTKIEQITPPKNTPKPENTSKEDQISSIYQQLMKQRQQLRLARTEFEQKWGSFSMNSTKNPERVTA